MRRGLIRDDLRREGKVPVRNERLTIERIVGDISLAIFKKSSGSRSPDEFDDWDSKLAISSRMAEVREERDGVREGGKWWAGVKEG